MASEAGRFECNGGTSVGNITDISLSGLPSAPADWTLSLSGAKNTTISRTYFEQGLACPASGHQVFWTDTDNNTWGGVPLWVLVAMVDDNPDVGPDHFNFNDSIAAQGYSVKVSSGDGWDTTLASQAIAQITVTRSEHPEWDPPSAPDACQETHWPLHLKGAAVFGGQQVGNITNIELTGSPSHQRNGSSPLKGMSLIPSHRVLY